MRVARTVPWKLVVHGGSGAMKRGAQQAADRTIADVGALGGRGGVIVVTPAGDAVHAFSTPGMYRGMASAKGAQVAIYDDE